MGIGRVYEDDRARRPWGDGPKNAKVYGKIGRRNYGKKIIRREMTQMGDCQKPEDSV